MTDASPRIKAVIADHFGVAEDVLTPETRFFEHLEADDLSRLDLIMRVEEMFAVEFSDNDIEDMRSVGDLLTTVNGKLAERVIAEEEAADERAANGQFGAGA